MHWIRSTRYFKATSRIRNRPPRTDCHQCENAPCEQGAPLPQHSNEGLNEMAYNRHRHRYCLNNARTRPPVKLLRISQGVQRRAQQGAQALFKPEVTVGARGVMESAVRCSDPDGRSRRSRGRALADGEIVPRARRRSVQAFLRRSPDKNSRGRSSRRAPRSACSRGLYTKPRTVPREGQEHQQDPGIAATSVRPPRARGGHK